MRFLIVLATLAIPLAIAQDDGIAYIEGTVRDDMTGLPLGRAKVYLSPAGRFDAVTDATGRFRIEATVPRIYQLFATRPGYVASRLDLSAIAPPSVAVAPGSTVQARDIRLRPQGVIRGRVTDPRGEPVHGAVVSARVRIRGGALGTPFELHAHTDDRGEYRITGLPAATYTVAVNPDHVRTGPGRGLAKATSRPVPMHAGTEVTGVDIELDEVPYYRLGVRITGIDPANICVTTVRQAGQGGEEVPFAAGWLREGDVAAGVYSVSVQCTPSSDELWLGQTEADLRDRDTVADVLLLPRDAAAAANSSSPSPIRAWIRARVLNPDGTPARGAVILADATRPRTRITSPLTDDYSITEVDPGEYLLLAIRTGEDHLIGHVDFPLQSQSGVARVKVAPGATESVDLVLTTVIEK